MHLAETKFAIQAIIYGCDPNKYIIGGVVPQYDPDVIPKKVPLVTVGFNPVPYSKHINTTLHEWTFWYESPDIHKISRVIDAIEEQSGKQNWHPIKQQNKQIGTIAYEFFRTPATGGRHKLKYVILYAKVYTIFNEDSC